MFLLNNCWPLRVEQIADTVEIVLKEDDCFHTYLKGDCPHDGCSNHRENLKEGEEKCPHGEEYTCRCALCLRELLKAYSSAKVELPEKITFRSDGVHLIDTIRTWEKINAILDYLSAQSSPE